jgi:hypothetical protein
MAGQVVERAELREVQLPPQWVSGGQDCDDDAGREGGHGGVAEVMGMVTSPVSRHGRADDRGDAQAFGRGEEGQRTHVLQVRRTPNRPNPHTRTLRESSRYADAIPRSAVVPLRS